MKKRKKKKKKKEGRRERKGYTVPVPSKVSVNRAAGSSPSHPFVLFLRFIFTADTDSSSLDGEEGVIDSELSNEPPVPVVISFCVSTGRTDKRRLLSNA